MSEEQNHDKTKSPLESRLNPSEFRRTDSDDLQDLRKDPVFQELLISYQNTEWEKSSRLIDDLLLRYPNTSRLLDFKADIQTQLMLFQQSRQEAKARERLKFRTLMRWVAALAVILLIGSFAAYQAAKTYERSIAASKVQVEQTKIDRLASLESQAVSLLEAGKAPEALDVINQIQAIDPDYPALPGLLEKTSNMISLTTLYEEALLAMQTGEDQAALEKLNQVKAIDPLFRDVDYQIGVVNNRLQVVQWLADAETAYREQRWMDTVQSYEQALEVDSTVNSPMIKDRMVNSYLRSIVETLSNEDETIEELERSERYYRKAIALIPQDKEYIAERENLRQLSVELLIAKYSQTARTILADQNHTVREVEQAIGYLKKAVELGGENSPMNSELTKAQLYYSGLKFFNGEKWEQAIRDLEELAKFNSSYPNGMTRQLLYEAYSARGQRYFAGGFYMDARINFEAAEVIAWEDPANVLRLYQVQIDIGNVLAKLDSAKDAVSYYQYALNAINIYARAKSETALLQNLQAAETLAQQGKYLEAVQSYSEILPQIEKYFVNTEVEVLSGDNLAFVAGTNHSTIRAIRKTNLMTDTVTVSRGQVLLIPTLP